MPAETFDSLATKVFEAFEGTVSLNDTLTIQLVELALKENSDITAFEVFSRIINIVAATGINAMNAVDALLKLIDSHLNELKESQKIPTPEERAVRVIMDTAESEILNSYSLLTDSFEYFQTEKGLLHAHQIHQAIHTGLQNGVNKLKISQ